MRRRSEPVVEGQTAPDLGAVPWNEIAILPEESARAEAWLAVKHGVATFRDPRLIRPGCEAFCRRLAEEAALFAGVLRTQICTETATWLVEFEEDTLDPEVLAAHLARTVKEAIPALRRGGSRCVRPTSWAAFRDESGAASVWEVVTIDTGRIQLRTRSLKRRPILAMRAARALRSVHGVHACRVGRWTGILTVECDASSITPLDLAAAAEEILPRSRKTSLHGVAPLDRGRIALAPFSGRARDLILAGGSFLMVIVGVILPGIPTAPFLLSTGYFVIRSWPGSRRWFQRFPRLLAALDSPLPSPDPAELAKSVIIAAISVIVFLVVHPPLPLILGFELALFAAYALRWSQQTADDLSDRPLEATPVLATT